MTEVGRFLLDLIGKSCLAWTEMWEGGLLGMGWDIKWTDRDTTG